MHLHQSHHQMTDVIIETSGQINFSLSVYNFQEVIILSYLKIKEFKQGI